jgi:hypothetical protein
MGRILAQFLAGNGNVLTIQIAEANNLKRGFLKHFVDLGILTQE